MALKRAAIAAGSVNEEEFERGSLIKLTPVKPCETNKGKNHLKSKLAMTALIAMVSVPSVLPTPALARHHVYRGHDRNYRHRCGGGNGAVGTIAGGAGGALLGNAIGGGLLGTVAGGVGGALLGRHLDKTHTRHRHGC